MMLKYIEHKIYHVNHFLKGFIYLYFREWKGGRKRGRETHQCVVASRAPPTGDLACNPGVYLDWESNQRLFGSQLVINPLSYTSQGSF